MRKRNRRAGRLYKEEDTDPLSVVVNLFDVAMVFAVALMVAMVMNMNMTEMFTDKDFTIVKNPGKENMEIITKEVASKSTATRHRKSRRGLPGRKVGKWASHTSWRMEKSSMYLKTDVYIFERPCAGVRNDLRPGTLSVRRLYVIGFQWAYRD